MRLSDAEYELISQAAVNTEVTVATMLRHVHTWKWWMIWDGRRFAIPASRCCSFYNWATRWQDADGRLPAGPGNGSQGLPITDMAKAGGRRSTDTWLKSYQQADDATILRVVERAAELRDGTA